MVDVVENDLRVAGHGVILANSNGQRANDLGSLRLLHQRRVDALIAAVADDLQTDLVEAMLSLPIPVVLLDRKVDADDLSLATAEDGPLVSLHTPGITAIERGTPDLSRRAAKLVLA